MLRKEIAVIVDEVPPAHVRDAVIRALVRATRLRQVSGVGSALDPRDRTRRTEPADVGNSVVLDLPTAQVRSCDDCWIGNLR